MPRRPPRRLPGFDYTGHRHYFLTFCTFQRQRHFSRADVVERTLTNFLQAATAFQVGVIAYCFMPDHVHFLVEGLTPHSNVARFISLAKQKSAHAHVVTCGGRLWQRYGYEHILRTNESVFGVAKYILENPVRAGLAAAPEAYPFSGSQLYSMAEILASVGAFNRPGGAG